MTRVPATYDGEVFRPEEPVELPPNTRVLLTVDSGEADRPAEKSFLETALALSVDGPEDEASKENSAGEPGSFFRTARSLNLDGEYLYSERTKAQ